MGPSDDQLLLDLNEELLMDSGRGPAMYDHLLSTTDFDVPELRAQSVRAQDDRKLNQGTHEGRDPYDIALGSTAAAFTFRDGKK